MFDDGQRSVREPAFDSAAVRAVAGLVDLRGHSSGPSSRSIGAIRSSSKSITSSTSAIERC
jgi:hypothetical protein